MREKMDGRKFDREAKIKEERAALQAVKDQLEKQDALKMRSSDILKNEFLFFNDQKQLDNQLKKQEMKKQRQEDKYDHFPFVSGEMLDQHREGLGVELRADLKNYMIAKAQGNLASSGKGSHHNRYSPERSNKSGSSWVASDVMIRSDRLERNAPVTTSVVKSLNDSCYVVPEKNHRVFQDNNPVKSQAFKAALDKYEQEV